MIARRLGQIRRRLVAAPKVAEKLGKPKSLADLETKPCLAFAPEGSTWDLERGRRPRASRSRRGSIVNDYEMLRSVARAGFGIALLPEHLCAEDLRDGRLVPVLDSWSAPEVPVFALYPSARHLSPTVIALLELLRQRLSFSAA